MRLAEYKRELALAALVLAVNLCWLGHVGLFDVDEAIFAEATREMVESGDWVTPTYNGKPRYDKPVLIYWLMAPAIKHLGPTPAAARLVSATGGALMALLLALVGRAMFGGGAGLWAALVMATCLHGFALARMSITDMTLTTLMAAGWLGLWAASERGSPGWMAVGAAALGLATLTKGPVALVLPLASWLLWALLARRLGPVLRDPRYWASKLVFLGIVLPWCVLIYQAHGWDFFRDHLGYHNLNRLTNTQAGHGGPFFTFALLVLGGLAPWSGFACAGLAAGVRHALDRAGAWRESAEARALVYLALWLLTVLGLFSLSRTKLPNYIAPLYPAAALLAGWAADRGWGQRAWCRWLNVAPLALIGLGLASTGLWVPRLTGLQRELGGGPLELGSRALVPGVALLVAALLGLVAAAREAPVARRRLAAAGWLAGLALWLGVAPIIYHYQQGTLRVITHEALERMKPDDELATLNIHVPSLAFTAQRRFQRITVPPKEADPAGYETNRAPLEALLQGERTVFLITQKIRTRGALDGLPHHVWADHLGWQLISNREPPPGYHLPAIPWTERDARELGRGR